MPPQLGWREAAIEVLKNRPEGMLYTDIAKEIINLKLRTSLGATPSSSVNVAMSDSIRKEANSPFERTGTGWYRLRSEAASPPALSDQGEAPATPTQEAEELEEKKETTGLINAFGMYWSKDRVHWNAATPKMLGRQTAGSEPVDFSDQRGVYLLYDRSSVIYVGRAVDQGIGTRLRQHISDRLSSRWERFSWFGIYKVSESGKLDTRDQNYDRGLLIATMEALLIEAVEPRQNRRRGDEFSAVEFLQVDDPEVEKARKKAVLDEMRKNYV